MRLVLFAALSLATLPLAANASEDLAKKAQCNSCHTMEKKVLGPAFKDIAAKYKGDAKAEATLTNKIRKGGAGTWGAVPMPPQTAVSDADLKVLVKWILAGK